MKNFFYVLIVLSVIFSMNIVYAKADEEIYESKDNQDKNSNVTYPKEVSSDMLGVSYWVNKLGKEADRLDYYAILQV